MRTKILSLFLLASILTFGQVEPSKVKYEGKALKELTTSQKAIDNPEEIKKIMEWMVRNNKTLLSDSDYENKLQTISNTVPKEELKLVLSQFYENYISVSGCLKKII